MVGPVSLMMIMMKMMMCYVIKADNHQENLVLAETKKVEADSFVNFITINEVRYITEYNQVVRPTLFSFFSGTSSLKIYINDK